MQTQAKQIRVDDECDIRLHHADADMAIGAGKDLLVVVWRDRTTHAGVETCQRTFRAVLASARQSHALFTIIEARAKLPHANERRGIAALLRDANQAVQASAVVFEGNGFLAAAIRGIVTGLTLMAKQDFPHRVFERVSDAAQFIVDEQVPNNPEPFVARRIEAAIADFRRSLPR